MPPNKKSEFRIPKGYTSEATAAAGSASRWETVHMELFQDTSFPEFIDDPADLSKLDTHTPTPRSHTPTLGQCDLKFSRFQPPISSCRISEGDNRVKDWASVTF